MAKLLMLKGLPGSGKSTHARELAKNGYVRVNKDDLRAMLNDGKWSKANEKFVLKVRDFIVREALTDGKSVVVDDTNLAPKHREVLADIAKEFGATFETKFFDVEPEECIKRDLKRANSVGQKVIWDMYNQFLRKREVYVPPEDKPEAVIVDIDGTLAHMCGRRGPYEWAKVGGDDVDRTIADLVFDIRNADHRLQIIFLSGRDSICRAETLAWLRQYSLDSHSVLFMRPEGDMRKDSIVKRELFDEHIRDNYQVKFILDDRNQVVEMWRDMGLTCFQVAEGDF